MRRTSHIVLAAALLAGCEGGERTLPALFHPTTIVQWKGGGGYLAASYSDSRIQFVAQGGATLALVGAGSGRPGHVLRLALDEPRRTLWVLGADHAYLYRLPLGSQPPRLVAAAAVPFSRVHPRSCLPDLALDGEGRAYVSSTHSPTLAVVDPGTLQVRVQPLVFPVAPRMPWSLSALAFTPDRRFLIAADAATGTLWRIDPRDWAPQPIAGAGELPGACGFAWQDGRRLAIALGFQKGIAVVELSPDYRRALAPARRALESAFVFSLLAERGVLVFPVSAGRTIALRREPGLAPAQPQAARHPGRG